MRDTLSEQPGSPLATFHFFPPSSQEQRAFLVQLGGTILSLVVIGVLAWLTSETGLRAVLIGAGAGVLFLLARSAWQLEQKAARAQRSEIGVGENGFQFTDAKDKTQFVAWEKIETLEVRSGRLYLSWRGEKNDRRELQIGSREVENGMELIGLLVARGQSTPPPDEGFSPPSNFIPLQPK